MRRFLEFDTVCFVGIKGDGRLCLGGLCGTAFGASAIYIVVTRGNCFCLGVVTTGTSTGLRFFTICGASSGGGYNPVAITMFESRESFDFFVITFCASCGFRTGFGTSCILGGYYIVVFACVVTALRFGVNNINSAKSSLTTAGVFKLKGGSIDAGNGNGFSIRFNDVVCIFQTFNKGCHIFICCDSDNDLLDNLSIFS